MFKIKLFSIGKNKEEWLEQALNEYVKRLKPIAQFEYIWAKDDEQLCKLLDKETNVIALDPQGKTLDSKEFSKWFHSFLETSGSRISFVIGGHEGLPEKIKSTSTLLSLSKLTFTHQLTRLILMEQIYRAFEIAKGSQYNK